VYKVYGERARGLVPLLKMVPPQTHIIGMVTFDDPEASLWWPLGSRRIEHVLSGDTAKDLRQRGIEYVFVSSEKFAMLFTESFDQWLARINGEKVGVLPLRLRAGGAPVEWYVVRL
jgi:hypothetical protein